MKKIILALIILSVVMLAVIKLSLDYFTQDFVDYQIRQAKPQIEISYQQIKTSLAGRTTLSGVKVYFPYFDESINVDSIQLMAPDLFSLLTLGYTLQNNDLPSSLTMIITGASLDLNSKMMKMLDDPYIEPTKIEIFSTLACGEVHRIGSKALSAMGYDSLTSDIILSYQFNPRDKTLHYDIRNHIRDISHLNLSGVLDKVDNLKSLKNKQARLGKVVLEVLNDSYIERKNKFCANQGKVSISDYINNHILQIEEYLLSYGVEPEEGLINAYKTILETSGSIIFEANLNQLTGTTEIMSFEPNDIIQFIHLKLFINEKRINEISIHIDKEKLIETATSDDIKVETPDEIKKKKAVIIKKYRPVSVANLQNFNGFRVKVETHSGKHYKGNINSKNPRIYEVITRLRSGNISYFIPVGKIKKAEVFN